MNKTPFNNGIEIGLRILSILNEAFPNSIDIQSLIYLDYITVHSGDFGSKMTSLHPAVPHRIGEIYVKRTLFKEALDLFISKGLIDPEYSNEGLKYKATDYSSPFLGSLDENYVINLLNRAKWVVNEFELNSETLKILFEKQIGVINNEFNIEILE